jgi:hypothetical protein
MTEAPPVDPAPIVPPVIVKTAARRHGPSQPVDVAALRAKFAAASGGSISLKPKFSNEAVVERYAGKVKNRITAIRAKCIECSCGMPSEVTNCGIDHCGLHKFRMGSDPFRQARAAGEDPPVLKIISSHPLLVKYCERVRNRATGMRAFCMQCTNAQPHLVRECQMTKCALHPFRMGGDPMRAARAESRVVAGLEGEDEPPEDHEDEDTPEEGDCDA